MEGNGTENGMFFCSNLEKRQNKNKRMLSRFAQKTDGLFLVFRMSASSLRL